MRRTTVIGAALWLAAGLVPARAAELGALPEGAVSHSRMGPADEIITYVVFDPAPFRSRLPAGTDFLTLQQMADRDADIAAHLKAHPEHSGWAWSFFEIIGVRAMAYDGVKARLGPHGGMAVWYPSLRRTDRSDTRPKGHNELALGTWVSDPRLAAHMRARGYPADFGRVRFSSGATRLTARLDAPGLRIEAGCRLEGPSFVPDWGQAPFSYETIWTPSDRASTFEVVSWGGHRSRNCAASGWRVAGPHAFAAAMLARPHGGGGVSGTEAAFGYQLRGALYRR